MKKMDFNTYVLEEYMNDAYYTVRWSKYLKYEKYDILKRLPELAGVYVIFYINQHKKLTPFFLGYSWVGSLRYDIKILSDEDAAPVDKKITEIINDKEKECYYKYLTVANYNDLMDLYEYFKFFYRFIDHIQISENKDSGRFNNIYVKEYEEEKN